MPCNSDVISEERKKAQSDFSYNLITCIILLIYHIHYIVYKVIKSAVIEIICFSTRRYNLN